MPGVKWEECVKRSVCKWNKHSCRLRLCACVNCAFEWQLIYSALGEKDKRAQVSVYNRREQSECQPVHEVVQREERSASRPPSSSSSLPPAGESSDWSLSDIPNTKPSPRALAAWTRTKSFFFVGQTCAAAVQSQSHYNRSLHSISSSNVTVICILLAHSGNAQCYSRALRKE